MVSVSTVKYVVAVKPLAAFFCRLDIYRLQRRYRHKVVGIPGQIAYVSFSTYGLIFLQRHHHFPQILVLALREKMA